MIDGRCEDEISLQEVKLLLKEKPDADTLIQIGSTVNDKLLKGMAKVNSDSPSAATASSFLPSSGRTMHLLLPRD